MTPITLVKMLETFSNNYGTKQPTEDTINLYEGYLKDIPDEKVPAIVNSIITTEQFYPNIATIRIHYANLGIEKMSEAELLEKTQKYISGYGRYRRVEMMEAIKENETDAFYQTIKAIGTGNLMDCDLNFKSGQIARVFKELQQGNVDQAKMLGNNINKNMIGE